MSKHPLSEKRRALKHLKTDWKHLTKNQIAAWYMAVDQTRAGHAPEADRHGRHITLTERAVIYMPQMMDV